MAKINVQKVKNMMKQIPDGWKFDLNHLALRGENRIEMYIRQDDDHYVIAYMGYIENPGPNWWTSTGVYHIEMNVSFWSRSGDSDVFTSHGLGKTVNLGGEYTRREFKRLCEAAKGISAADVMDIYNGKSERMGESA